MRQNIDDAIPTEHPDLNDTMAQMGSAASPHSDNGDADPAAVPDLAREQPANPSAEAESIRDLLRATDATLTRMDARLGQIETQLQHAAPAARPPLPLLAGASIT